MFLVGILSWWYSDGLVGSAHRLKQRLGKTADFFSIGILAETLFAPFRQISSGVRGLNPAASLAVFIDKAFARIFGAFLRIIMIIIGLVVLLLQLLFSIISLAVWLLTPVFPIIGIFLATIGWLPWM